MPSIAIIGCVGIPNRYGGFESFAEHIAPFLAARGHAVTVTADRSRYLDDLSECFRGVRRLFLPIPANGALSTVHDLAAFFAVLSSSKAILVLGVSGGVFFPVFRLLCGLCGRRLLVNIDGVEWRRRKFGRAKRAFLYLSDWLAQRFAHVVVFDNEALGPYVRYPQKSRCIEYSGDHAAHADGAHAASPEPAQGYALTICRVEPENNCEMLLEGFLRSEGSRYVFVGNWAASPYGRDLKARYASNGRLRLLDPIYDPAAIQALRRHCGHYLHGHSVGGTNPSLVEMLFFDCEIHCYDCAFNRVTARDAASYFDGADSLARNLQQHATTTLAVRQALRKAYSAAAIAGKLEPLLARDLKR